MIYIVHTLNTMLVKELLSNKTNHKIPFKNKRHHASASFFPHATTSTAECHLIFTKLFSHILDTNKIPTLQHHAEKPECNFKSKQITHPYQKTELIGQTGLCNSTSYISLSYIHVYIEWRKETNSLVTLVTGNCWYHLDTKTIGIIIFSLLLLESLSWFE